MMRNGERAGKTWNALVRLGSQGRAYPSLVEWLDSLMYCLYYEEGKGSSIRPVHGSAGRDQTPTHRRGEVAGHDVDFPGKAGWSGTTTMEAKMKASMILPILGLLVWASVPPGEQTRTIAGWVKYPDNPVLGGDLGTCFDISVLKEGNSYRMWISWRPKKSIALVESKDGVKWSKPVIVLGPNNRTDWENDLNRPVVIKNGDRYQMWYTGQAGGKSWIGYATSRDGVLWERMSDRPVLAAEKPWEKAAVMCPHVLYDDQANLYRMWYSGGEQYEPNAIGYATSLDGLKWTRYENNPIFKPDPRNAWEKDQVTACQVVRQGDWHIMFYIGFRDVHYAQVGVARSRDGITDWQRHRANPIIRPGKDQWDHDAVYKPYAVYDGKQWLLWYNGRKDGVEQIGLALHPGEDLGF
jgi:predicted GH43/DUF377 family glycosyl hydrolase